MRFTRSRERGDNRTQQKPQNQFITKKLGKCSTRTENSVDDSTIRDHRRPRQKRPQLLFFFPPPKKKDNGEKKFLKIKKKKGTSGRHTQRNRSLASNWEGHRLHLLLHQSDPSSLSLSLSLSLFLKNCDQNRSNRVDFSSLFFFLLHFFVVAQPHGPTWCGPKTRKTRWKSMPLDWLEKKSLQLGLMPSWLTSRWKGHYRWNQFKIGLPRALTPTKTLIDSFNLEKNRPKIGRMPTTQ